MEHTELLDEWEITLIVRHVPKDTGESLPYKWDYTTLLDLNTGLGEQAWVERSGIIRSGTEKDLDSYRAEDVDD
jgi:hypothetical protein